MNIYVTDKDQIEMIKNWWRENGKFTILSIVAAIILSAGWHYWQNTKNKEAAAASVIYEQILNNEVNNQLSAVEFDVTSLMTNYPKTPYASLAAFISAQNAINSNHFDTAIEKFDWVIANSKNKDFQQIARIRKARTLLATKKFDEALQALSGNQIAAYLPLSNEVKGDILSAKGDKQGAMVAYQNALNSTHKEAPNRNFLQMKYDQLRN